AVLAVLPGRACRARPSAARSGAPHAALREGVGGRLLRAGRRAAAAGPEPDGHPSRRRARDAERPRTRPEPGARRRLGAARAPAGAAAARAAGRSRVRRPGGGAAADVRPAGLGAPGPFGGHAVRAGPPVPPDGLVPARRAQPPRPRPALRRDVHRARCGRPHGADLRAARRRPHPGRTPMTLTASYEHCRRLNARHGRSFYLATLLLPQWKRRHVHALYGFTRHVDDIVDSCGEEDAEEREKALDGVARRLGATLAGEELRG